jgi:hypothetical protein
MKIMMNKRISISHPLNKEMVLTDSLKLFLICRKFIKKRRTVRSTIKKSIFVDRGVQIESSPEIVDKAMNPIKNASSGFKLIFSHFFPAIPLIAVTSENPRIKNTKNTSSQTKKTRIILYLLNIPYLKIQ